MKKDLLSILDLSREECLGLFALARKMKANPKEYAAVLEGKAGALVFEKPSLRTRVTFEVGLAEMGGYAVYLAPTDVGVGKRESVEDVARALSRWVHVIIARTFEQETIEDLAGAASVSVINALSNAEHPCQALADYLTVFEKFGDFKSPKMVYVGDGNNVCVSLLYLAAILGATFSISTPSGYEPPKEAFTKAQHLAGTSGAKIMATQDPAKAVEGADVIYTDTWTSMGQEDSAETRRLSFQGYRVDEQLMAKTGRKTLFMHCLPAHRGEEVSPEVIDGPNSIVFDQAENRLHVQKAILYRLLVERNG
jgi:ornithine carbamoyltransferase